MKLLVNKESLNNKKLQKIFLCCLILLTTTSHSQPDNLVVNGGFEQHSYCVPQGVPDQEQYLAYSYYWINPTLATPDFFHPCSNDNSMDIPHNWMGFQYPHSGEAYGGGGWLSF